MAVIEESSLRSLRRSRTTRASRRNAGARRRTPDGAAIETITPAAVSDIVTDEFSISFEVDEIGKPVLVRTSYFPNWEATERRGRIGCRRTSWSSSRPIRRSSSATDGRASNSSVSCSRSSARLPVRAASDPGRDRWPTVDLGSSPLDLLPSRALVLAEVQGARVSPASVDRLVDETAERTCGRGRAHAGLALVGVTLVLHLVVGPTTEEPLVSLALASRHRRPALGRVRPWALARRACSVPLDGGGAVSGVHRLRCGGRNQGP